MAPQNVPAGCYSFVDAQHTSFPVPLVINPANSNHLSEDFVVSAIAAAAHTWDRKIPGQAFDNDFQIDPTAQAPLVDGTNTIAFSDIFLDTSIVAVTSIYVDDSTTPAILYEFDIALNSKIAWGDATLDPDVIDLQNAITHELGHALGLGDVWSAACQRATMYGYSRIGDTRKRTLSRPDIIALRLLYQRIH